MLRSEPTTLMDAIRLKEAMNKIPTLYDPLGDLISPPTVTGDEEGDEEEDKDSDEDSDSDEDNDSDSDRSSERDDEEEEEDEEDPEEKDMEETEEHEAAASTINKKRKESEAPRRDSAKTKKKSKTKKRLVTKKWYVRLMELLQTYNRSSVTDKDYEALLPSYESNHLLGIQRSDFLVKVQVDVVADGSCNYHGPVHQVPADRLMKWWEYGRVSGYGNVQTQTTEVNLDVRNAREWTTAEVSVPPHMLDVLAVLWGRMMQPAHVRVELYKLNCYGPGGGFAAHKDTSQTDLVGTILMGLGDTTDEQAGLKVEGRSEVWRSFPGATIFFYPDITHEVLRVTKGYRATLAFKVFVDRRTDTSLYKTNERLVLWWNARMKPQFLGKIHEKRQAIEDQLRKKWFPNVHWGRGTRALTTEQQTELNRCWKVLDSEWCAVNRKWADSYQPLAPLPRPNPAMIRKALGGAASSSSEEDDEKVAKPPVEPHILRLREQIAIMKFNEKAYYAYKNRPDNDLVEGEWVVFAEGKLQCRGATMLDALHKLEPDRTCFSVQVGQEPTLDKPIGTMIPKVVFGASAYASSSASSEDTNRHLQASSTSGAERTMGDSTKSNALTRTAAHVQSFQQYQATLEENERAYYAYKQRPDNDLVKGEWVAFADGKLQGRGATVLQAMEHVKPPRTNFCVQVGHEQEPIRPVPSSASATSSSSSSQISFSQLQAKLRDRCLPDLEACQLPFGFLLGHQYALSTTDLIGPDAALLELLKLIPSFRVIVLPVLTRYSGSAVTGGDYDHAEDATVYPLTDSHLRGALGQCPQPTLEEACRITKAEAKQMQGVRFVTLNMKDGYEWSKKADAGAESTGNESRAAEEDSVWLHRAIVVVRKDVSPEAATGSASVSE